MPRRGRDSLFAVAFAAALVAAALGACAEAPPAARGSRQHAGHAAPAPGFLDLRSQARQAREQGDLGAAAELLAQAHRMAPQNPVVSLHLAEVLAATGDRAAALGQLQRLAAGGVSMDLVASPELARLAGDPRFASLLQAMERNRAPIARAEIVCELDAPGLLPEGIDLDPRRRRVVLGSFSTGQLVTAALDGSSEELLPAGTLGGVAGIRVDPVRRVVWATSNSDGEGEGPPPAVVAVDLDSGDVVARKELAAGAAPVLLNDLAVTPDGTVFVTETLQGAVLRTCLACPGLELLLRSDRLPLANGITTGGDGTTLYVAHAAGISRIDTTSGAEERLAVPPGEVSVGADGLYWHEGTLIAVQNQPFHDRIVRFWLDEAGATILRTQILNARHPGGMFHSTGFVLDGHFFFNGVAGGLPPPGGLEEQRTYLLTVPLGDPPPSTAGERLRFSPPRRACGDFSPATRPSSLP